MPKNHHTYTDCLEQSTLHAYIFFILENNVTILLLTSSTNFNVNCRVYSIFFLGMNVVHLIKGPHGSMVMSPVEAKLHIDSDALKPNDEGVVIDYENHFKSHHKVADILND